MNTFRWNATTIIPCACGFILWSFRTIVKVFLGTLLILATTLRNAKSGGMGALAGPWMHRLCILGHWLLLQGGCEDSTWWNLDEKSVVKSVESSKCMTMVPWIHHEQILSLDQTDLDGGFPLAKEEIPQISDVAGPQVGPGGTCIWALGLLSRPLGPNVHVCHHFGVFLPYFLHTNNSTSTSGTRWNLNINLHMWWWFSMLLGQMLMVKTGVSDRQQAPPSYPFVVLSKDAGLA
jgi:hypothetical protein